MLSEPLNIPRMFDGHRKVVVSFGYVAIDCRLHFRSNEKQKTDQGEPWNAER